MIAPDPAATLIVAVIGVVLERTIANGVKIRPTNTTATINVAAGSGAITDDERDAAKAILLHNGPKGGFTQQFKGGGGDHLVSDNIAALITDA